MAESFDDSEQHEVPQPGEESAGSSHVSGGESPEISMTPDAEAAGPWPAGDDWRDPADPEPLIDMPEDDAEREEPAGEMGFFDHLEELRSRIIKAAAGLILAALVCAFFSNTIIENVLLGPAQAAGLIDPTKNKELLNVLPMGQLTLTLQVALVSGMIIAIPWILWQFWEFVRPGLFPKERRYASWVGVFTIVCFLAGVAFAYWVLLPASLGFAANFAYKGIENRIAVNEYFSFVLGFILACGVVFEMPMLSFALARFGILTPAFMRKYRRHAAIVILIVAAIITPTPDPFNQLVLAVPLYFLYEISIFVASMATRQRQEAYSEMFPDAPPQS